MARWVLPCDGHQYLSAQTPTHYVPWGLPVGATLLRGLRPTRLWGELTTLRDTPAVALGGHSALFCSPTRPWYLDPLLQACAFSPVPVPCYGTHKDVLHGQPKLWLMPVFLLQSSVHSVPRLGVFPDQTPSWQPFPQHLLYIHATSHHIPQHTLSWLWTWAVFFRNPDPLSNRARGRGSGSLRP